MSNQGGYVNEITGQTLIVLKKEFSENYEVLLFAGQQTNTKEGKKISPAFSTKAKACSQVRKFYRSCHSSFRVRLSTTIIVKIAPAVAFNESSVQNHGFTAYQSRIQQLLHQLVQYS